MAANFANCINKVNNAKNQSKMQKIWHEEFTDPYL